MPESGRRFLAALALLITASSHAAEPTPAASVVRFYTVCANCHEGQCSGRLTFHTGATEARGHMQRYLGSITDGEAAGKSVRTAPSHQGGMRSLPAGQPGQRRQPGWAPANWPSWRNAREGGYFIPLGALGKGEYQLRLDLSVVGNGKVKLTDDRFEPLVEESLCPQQNARIPASKAEGGPSFPDHQGAGRRHPAAQGRHPALRIACWRPFRCGRTATPKALIDIK